MSKRALTLIIVVVVLGGLIGAYFWITRPKPNTAASTVNQLELSKGDKDKIAKVVLTDRKEGTLTLVKSGGAWTSDPASVAKVDSGNMDDLLYTFSGLFAERVIDKSPSNMAQFGLEPPQAVATATWEDGTSRTLILGNKTDAGNTYYMQVKGNPAVYTVWVNNGEHLHWTMNDLRSKSVSPTINYDEIAYVKLVEKSGTTIEVRQKSPDEAKSYQYGFGGFVVIRPYPTPRGLDANSQDALIKGTQGITISDFVDDTPKDLSKYGLARPWGEAVVRDKSNTVDFLFGGQTADGTKTYFMIKDQPSVMTVDTSALSFMTTKPFDIVDKFAFIPNIDDVDRIEVTAGGKTAALAIARTTKKAEKAGEQDEVVASYTVNGKTAQEQSFKVFYQVLIGLIVEGEVTHKVPDAPEVSVTYWLNKGTSKTTRVDLARYDRDFDAVFVNGVCTFALSKGQVTRMLGKLDDLLAGREVKD